MRQMTVARNSVPERRRLAPITLLALLMGCTNTIPRQTGQQLPPAQEKPPAGAVLLKGAGATFPSLLYARWFEVYHGAQPNTYINYAAVGSGEGIRRFVGKNVADDERVDFGASDAAMSDAEIAAASNDVLMIPATAGCVALAYNLPGLGGTLRLSRQAYAGIFLGEITTWNDPLIAQSNPGIKLPNLTIVTVVRQDSSGTTFAFTRNLDAISGRWREQFGGAATLVNWPGNAMRAKGNEGVAGLIEKSTGSIGYVGYEFAHRIDLDMASLENKDGKFLNPTEQTCAAALATAEMPQNLRVFIPDPAGADSYPIVTFSWILLRKSYKNLQTAQAIREFFRWALQDGQRYAPELGYLKLPTAVEEKALAALNAITSGS